MLAGCSCTRMGQRTGWPPAVAILPGTGWGRQQGTGPHRFYVASPGGVMESFPLEKTCKISESVNLTLPSPALNTCSIGKTALCQGLCCKGRGGRTGVRLGAPAPTPLHSRGFAGPSRLRCSALWCGSVRCDPAVLRTELTCCWTGCVLSSGVVELHLLCFAKRETKAVQLKVQRGGQRPPAHQVWSWRFPVLSEIPSAPQGQAFSLGLRPVRGQVRPSR